MMIALIEGRIREFEEKIRERTEDYEEDIKLLMSIPGVNSTSAEILLAELGNDFSQFPSASKVCKWAGVAPGSNESGGKKFSSHITKAGRYLKPILNQIAWAAVKAKCPYYRIKFERMRARIGTKRAIVAIMRKILVSIWNMFRYGSEWAPRDMDEEGRPLDASIRNGSEKLKAAITELSSLGLSEEAITAQVRAVVSGQKNKQ